MKQRVATILLLLSLALSLTGCGSKAPQRRTVYAMDTVMTLTVYGENAAAALDEAEQQLLALDALLDRTEESSDIYALNHGGTATDERTLELLRAALEISAATNGAFDPTVAPVMDAWGFTTENRRVPSAEELASLLACVDASQVEAEQPLPAGFAMDLGGIAKGYAGGLVRDIVRAHGVSSAVIDLGGDVCLVGKKPAEGLFGSESDWRVAVKDPADSAKLLGVAEVSDCFIVTSGVYERNFEENGVRYHHIIDPATGNPVDNGLVSVTVVCGAEHGAWADALSTACFVLGVEESLALRERLADTVPFELIFVTEDLYLPYDANVLYTDALAGRFTPEQEGTYRYAPLGEGKTE